MRKSRRKRFGAFSVLLVFAGWAAGATITVGPGASYDFADIQPAIDAASVGDEIVVAIGTYYENIDFGGKDIILRSTEPNNPAVVGGTIIDGRYLAPAVTFAGTESAACVLSGFTITLGAAYNDDGGGIDGNGSHATVEHNAIIYNFAWLYVGPDTVFGGGIHDCDGLIQYNLIMGNEAQGDEGLGGGGGLSHCDGTIHNNVIAGNGGYLVAGGGLYKCHGVIRNNTIFGNDVLYGGGLAECSGSITNCIVWGNTAYEDDQLRDCATPSYCCIEGWTGDGTGNIPDDPILADTDANDFHLLVGSPCIDAGDVMADLADDFEGDLRPNGTGYDIGADEYVGDNLPPDKPYHIYPEDGDIDISLTSRLRGSNFSDPDANDSHIASQWHLWASDTGWTIWSETKREGEGRLTTIGFPSPRVLSDNMKYTWSVRYQDDRGLWGEWSEPTEFMTEYTGEVVNVPEDFATIQAAIDAAIYGDEIVVSPGRYVENINFKGKNIVVRSTAPEDPGVATETVIDGNESGSVVTFAGTEPNHCVLAGFTITNGTGAPTYLGRICGGGILGNWSHATIRNNVISENTAGGGGGLAYCNGLIEGNTISRNVSDWKWTGGGGLYRCNGVIRGNNIYLNEAKNGGGISDCEGTIEKNIIWQNTAYRPEYSYGNGGGLYDCHGTIIENNVICGNTAGYGGGLGWCEAWHSPDTVIANCIIWGNVATHSGPQVYSSGPISFSCIEAWSDGGEGNISENPRFFHPTGGDFHLKSQVGRWDWTGESWVQDDVWEMSPCIDGGDPNSDWTGELWPHGKRINMGAYGGTAEASMSLSSAGNAADCNYDDAVNGTDLEMIAQKWLDEAILLVEDINRDGTVNFRDFALLAQSWLWEQ